MVTACRLTGHCVSQDLEMRFALFGGQFPEADRRDADRVERRTIENTLVLQFSCFGHHDLWVRSSSGSQYRGPHDQPHPYQKNAVSG